MTMTSNAFQNSGKHKREHTYNTIILKFNFLQEMYYTFDKIKNYT